MNAVAFKGLSQQEKDAKYQQYVNRKSNRQPVKVPKQIKPVAQRPNRSANNGNALATTPKGGGLKLTSISNCTLMYAKACYDPFDSNLDQVCIPDQICAPSYKYAATCQGIFEIGTTGSGWLIFNPWTMAVNDNGFGGTSADYPIIATTSTNVNSGIDYNISDFTNGYVTGYNSNSFFQVAQFQASTGKSEPVLRLVAGAVEVFYVGQLLNQSGAVTVLQNDGLKPFANATTGTTIKNNPRSAICATAKDARCYVTYSPTSAEFLSYKSLDTYRASALGILDNNPLVIYVDGATPGITFQFRAISHFEAQIPGMNATPSESDPIGYPALQAARSNVKPTTNPDNDLRTVLQGTLRNIGTSISGLAPGIGTAVGTIFGNPAAGTLAGTAASSFLSSLLGSNQSKM